MLPLSIDCWYTCTNIMRQVGRGVDGVTASTKTNNNWLTCTTHNTLHLRVTFNVRRIFGRWGGSLYVVGGTEVSIDHSEPLGEVGGCHYCC